MATLQQIIDYSKANPNTAYAKNAAQLITTGQFDQQALKEGIDLSPYGRPVKTPPSSQPKAGVTQTPNFVGTQNNATSGSTQAVPDNSTPDTISALGNTAKSLVSGTIESGKDIGAAISAPIVQKAFDSIDKADQQGLTTILQLRQQAKAKGQDTTHFDNLIKNYTLSNNQTVADVFPALKKSNEQIIGDFASMALEVASAGSYGNAAKGAETGSLLAKTGSAAGKVATATGIPATVVPKVAETGAPLLTRVAKGAATGAGVGAGFGATGALQNNESPIGIAKSTLVGGVAGAATGGVAEGVLGSKSSEEIAAKQAKNDNQVLEAISPKLPPTKMNKALSTGAVTNEQSGILGKIKPDFSGDKNLQKVASDVKEYITGKTDTQNLNNLRQGISGKAQEVSTFFEKNPVPTNFEDFQNKLDMVKPQTSLKKGTPEFKTYNDVKEKILQSVYNHVKKVANESGNFTDKTNMGDYWNARIALDQTAKTELGDKVFGTPQYTGAKAAVTDMRKAYTEFITDGLQFPGQMEQVNKLQDFLQTARSRGIDIPNEQSAIEILKKQFGLSSSQEDVARAAYFRDSMSKLKSMYTATDNIAPKARLEQGTTRFGRYAKKNPVKAKVAKRVAGAVITGAGLGTGYIGIKDLASE